MTVETEVESTAQQWSSRPGWAWLLRALLFVLPIASSVVVVLTFTRLVPRPLGFVPAAIWFVGVIALGTLVMRVVDHSLQRFVPVVMLLRMSLVFPDHAPSRFKLMMRQGTTRQLQREYDTNTLESTPQKAAEALLMLCSELGNHDRLTRGHSERVRAYSALIAEEMGIAGRDRELLHWAALLHDIGKLDVPEEILNKGARPDDDEWAVLRTHPAAAAAHLAPLESWLGEWLHAATQHHERWDGRGYPDGLAGEEISTAGRIVAVADAYDTITSVRSYKTARTPHDARIEIAQCSGAQFDPAVVRAFLSVSVGRLRGVMGPIAWIAQLPVILSAPVAIPAVTGAVAITTTAAALSLSGSLAPPMEPVEQQVVAAAESSELELDLAFQGDEVPAPGLATTSSGQPGGAVPAPTGTPAFQFPTATPLPEASPTLLIPGLSTITPLPQFTPIPTQPPAATASPTAAPTPTATPDLSTLYLTNPGSGNTTSSLVLALSPDGPTDSTLANFDTDRDDDNGLLLVRSSAGLGETNNAKKQIWSLDVGPQDLKGASVRLRAALKNYDQSESATLAVRFERCDSALTSCKTLGSNQKSFTQGVAGSFKTIVVNMTLTGGTTTKQPILVLKVVVTDASDDDVWLAYDTKDHEARVNLNS